MSKIIKSGKLDNVIASMDAEKHYIVKLRDGPKWEYKCNHCSISLFTMKRKKIKCTCNNLFSERLLRE